MVSMQNTNPLIPEDIIYVILLNLPTKSLLRFKSVCKSWMSTISAPDFVKKHLLLLTNDPYFTHHHLILAKKPFVPHFCPPILKLSTCSLYSLLREPEPLTKTMCHKPAIEGDIKYIFGYCNGLVCLMNAGYLVFWNPSTRKSRRLPKLETEVGPDDWSLGEYYVFCFDSVSDDFKVFALFGCSKYELSVYSSKSDSWRMIGDFPYGRVFNEGKFANGAIYWAVEEELSKQILISFDIQTETYREIMLPKPKETLWILGTFHNSPSILQKFGTHADFWVIEECDFEDHHWTKLFTIQDGYKYSILNPIYNFVDGSTLLSFDDNIELYNYEDHAYEGLLGFRVKKN